MALAASPAAAATISYTLSGLFPSFYFNAAAPGDSGVLSGSTTLEELAPSFDASLGTLTGATITETLGLSAGARWIPILKPGTSQIAIPPAVYVGLDVSSEIRAPLNVQLASGKVVASPTIFYELDARGGQTVTKTSAFSDATALSAFLSTSAPLTIVRAADLHGYFTNVASGSGGASAKYDTVITYT